MLPPGPWSRCCTSPGTGSAIPTRWPWTVATSGGPMASGARAQVLPQPSKKFSFPDAVAADGSHVWVANLNGKSVTELDAATGALVQVLDQPRYAFSYPGAVAAGGTHGGVADGTYAGSVTELDAATGALVQVLHQPRYKFGS